MDESNAEVLANRNEPIPVISHSSRPSDAKAPDATQHRRSGSTSGRSFQDRLFTKILEQVVPVEDVNNGTVSLEDKHYSADPQRPAFSLPLMGNNFRRFNARIGVVFQFQNSVERLLSWKQSSHTFSFLFIYSFLCLDPHLLVVMPLVIFLLFVMIPAFLARHPPPPSTSTSSIMPYYSYQGPALAPAKTIKPAPETSKDFFRNMRDLQNSMADFSDLHDTIVNGFTPMTNFSDEKLSSAVFLLGLIATVVLFMSSQLLPWRIIVMLGGNAAILSKHPKLQVFFQNIAGELMGDGGDLAPIQKAQKEALDAVGATLPPDPSAAIALMGSLEDISLDTYPEEREVEIFEIQWRSLTPFSESSWEHFLFTSMPYDPLSPYRIAGDRPKGCRFFEDVQPPTGWAFKSKKWELDLDCREWVVERMITGVGFEVPGNGSTGTASSDEMGGWVWDLPAEVSRREDDALADALGYDNLEPDSKPSSFEDKKPLKKGKGRASGDFEERGGGASQAMGEWRRRRWVRIVSRVSLPGDND